MSLSAGYNNQEFFSYINYIHKTFFNEIYVRYNVHTAES